MDFERERRRGYRLSYVWASRAGASVDDNFLGAELANRNIALSDPRPLFQNGQGGSLSRFGARLIVRRHVQKAAQSVPSLKSKRIHPHSLRHSTAVHLLKSGVDLSTIAHWLGHSSINTTHNYVSIDLEAKRAALAKAAPITTKAPPARRWKPGEDLLKWLESL